MEKKIQIEKTEKKNGRTVGDLQLVVKTNLQAGHFRAVMCW
jgi:hypothetical protein